jgi:hypothetical protein
VEEYCLHWKTSARCACADTSPTIERLESDEVVGRLKSIR